MMKRTPGKFTGIYREEDTLLDCSPKEQATIVEQILNGPRFSPDLLNKRLQEIEEYANDAAHSPKASNEIRSDASEVVMDIQQIRQFLLRKATERAIWKAIDLGHDFERLRIRACGAEKNAMRGRKVLAGAKKPDEKCAKRDAEIVDKMRGKIQRRGYGKQPTNDGIRKQLAKEYGLGLQQIRNITTEFNRKKVV